MGTTWELSSDVFVQHRVLNSNFIAMALIFRRRDQPNTSQQLKRVGGMVIGFSGFALLFGAMGLVVDREKIIAALVVCMALWGLATGIALLRLRPWARLSMLVFLSLLCICGALSVVFLFVLSFTMKKSLRSVQDLGVAMVTTAWFVMTSVTIGVQGLRFFRRDAVRAHFSGDP
jgi:hypothetical protein